MTEGDYRKTIAKNWLAKAGGALEIAEVSLNKKELISCVNRMYYAAFYAVSAVLANEGIKYGKHTAVRSALNRDLVKTGRLSKKYGDYYNALFDDRMAGDYEPSTDFTFDEVQNLLAITKEFISQCKKIVEST